MKITSLHSHFNPVYIPMTSASIKSKENSIVTVTQITHYLNLQKISKILSYKWKLFRKRFISKNLINQELRLNNFNSNNHFQEK